ncbi:calpain-12 [Antechinus flavipes]|uniref:calpain-12 n=1 Tax=Antechinus flavipes TaxID=38775 RepID=UPI0022367CFB|nr:calpain-12 [Antechinus flavipes]
MVFGEPWERSSSLLPTSSFKGPPPGPGVSPMAIQRVTIQLVEDEDGETVQGPVCFRGQCYRSIQESCLQAGALFLDPCFPAGPAALGYDQLGPNSEKAKGVEWLRPHEFCQNPQFICEDMDRTDVCQGRLGNCWFLAAAASLTLYPRLLHRVVPPQQSFQWGYAGIFHFQLWQFGRWVDVVVDDRLPVRDGKLLFVRSAQRAEFWAPLLEKAYAKLHGSYEVMRGGHMNEAFVDFTGGVGEVLYLQPDMTVVFPALRHALAKESLVGATALSDRGEIRTDDGLVKGHAYSVTGTHKMSLGFTKVKLLRLRNPWGQVEWSGAWSDSCPRWAALPEEWRETLLVKKEDGEFWMELNDFLKHFNTVQICSLSPEVLGPKPKGGGWHVHTFQGRWVRGFNAGGGQPGSETFWTNPQFQLTLQDPDEEAEDDDGRLWGGRHPKCTVLLSLIQRNRRRLRARGVSYLTVGFHVFRIPEELLDLQDSPRRRELLTGLLRADRSPFSIRRDVSRRCRLAPGHYLVVPSTAHAGEEADFTLRIFTERQHAAMEMDNAVSADLQVLKSPSAPLEFDLEQLFEELAGQEEEIGVHQLQTLLSIALEPADWAGPWTHPPGEIGLRTCEHLIRCFGQGGPCLTLSEFQQLWYRLQEWQATFNKFDADKSGTMNAHELRLALNSAGFQLNNQLTQLLTSRYRDSRLRVDLDRFVSCVVQLTCLFRHCSQHLSEGEELIYMTKRQWMELATFS